MSRIEKIEEPFEAFSFLSVIQQKRDDAETCRTVIAHRPSQSKESYTDRTSDPVFLFFKDMEKEYGNDREQCIIGFHNQGQYGCE